MSPELETHLLEMGKKVLAAEYVAKLAMRYATRDDPGLLERHTRMERVRLGAKRAGGEDASLAEMIVALLEEAAAMDETDQPGIRR